MSKKYSIKKAVDLPLRSDFYAATNVGVERPVVTSPPVIPSLVPQIPFDPNKLPGLERKRRRDPWFEQNAKKIQREAELLEEKKQQQHSVVTNPIQTTIRTPLQTTNNTNTTTTATNTTTSISTSVQTLPTENPTILENTHPPQQTQQTSQTHTLPTSQTQQPPQQTQQQQQHYEEALSMAQVEFFRMKEQCEQKVLQMQKEMENLHKQLAAKKETSDQNIAKILVSLVDNIDQQTNMKIDSIRKEFVVSQNISVRAGLQNFKREKMDKMITNYNVLKLNELVDNN